MQLKDFLEIQPQVHLLPEFDPKPSTPWHGIKALWYEGASYRGSRTKVFAYVGYPEAARREKTPAIVLVHGGSGHAYPEWIRLWNEKGFAAIAMDTTGFFPGQEWRGLVGTEGEPADRYEKELYGELVEEGFMTGPDNSEMLDTEEPVEDQWMYHAVSAVILAHNILRQDSRIDSNRIGIAGISWGGVITSLTIGYDNRYAFAVPIYGSAHLEDMPVLRIPKRFAEESVRRLWCAADRLQNVSFPVLWLCWCSDSAFHVAANSLSYLDTKEKGAYLSMLVDWGHSHVRGWGTQESFEFARSVLEGRKPLIKAITEPQGFSRIDLQVEIPEDMEKVSARVVYLTGPAEYEGKKMISQWRTEPAELTGDRVRAKVPPEAHCYFVEFAGYRDGVRLMSSSALVWAGGK